MGRPRTSVLSPGQRFGSLVVLADRGSRDVEVRCDYCGTVKTVQRGHLAGMRSCGCQSRASQRAAVTRHGHAPGHSGTRTYRSWRAMRSRCLNAASDGFRKYGGRGIKICERWLPADSFPIFLADMGERPDGTTIDRIDSHGNYEPTNCRWADVIIQRQNQRRMMKAA